MAGVAWGDPAVGPAQADEAVARSFTFSAADLGGLGGQAPDIKSPAAVLISLDTGRVLLDHNAGKRMRMASTTKIMTAVLVLEKLDLQQEVTVSPSAAATYEPKSWVREGDVLTVDELLYALLLRSANAAAVALAQTCSGTVAAFVEEMNTKAAELGMTATHFENPHGLDEDGHYSTAADMAILGRYAMQDERFREYVSTRTYELDLPGRREPLLLTNTNKLLHDYPWVIGVKTGLTPKAEQCLVAAGRRDGIEVLSVVLGQPVSDLCFDESKKLLQYGFTQCRDVTVLEPGAVLAQADVPYRLDGRIDLVASSGVALQIYEGDEVTVDVSVDSPLRLPVTVGQTCGRVVVMVNGDALETVNLVATRSFGAPTLGSKLAYFFGRLGEWIGGIF
jgi:D-alanyl-D-alanine carboxypeptidase (penicillin-binding protein 5/6)